MSTIKLPLIKNYIPSDPRAWVQIQILDMGGHAFVQISRFDGGMETNVEIPVRYLDTAKWVAAHLYNSYKNWKTLQMVDDLLKPPAEQPAPDDTKQPEPFSIEINLMGKKHDILNDLAALGLYMRQFEIQAGSVEGLKTGNAKITTTNRWEHEADEHFVE